MELIVRIVVIALAAICNFILLKNKIPAGYAYIWTLVGGNILILIETIISNGAMSPWWLLGHFFVSIYLLAGSFLGHILWLGYGLLSKNKEK